MNFLMVIRLTIRMTRKKMNLKTFSDIDALNSAGYLTVYQVNKIFFEKNSYLRVKRNDISQLLLCSHIFYRDSGCYSKNVIKIGYRNFIYPSVVRIKNLDFDEEIEVFEKLEVEELAATHQTITRVISKR